MSRRFACLLVVFTGVVLFPFRAPAPLVFTPGEGWTYEPVGGEGKWMRTRAKDQLEVGQAAFDKKDYSLALKAARRVVKVWPLSDYAPQAQYFVGRCYEARHNDEKAFKEYQVVLEKYPKSEMVNDVLQRQFEIANRFLNGEWFRLWGYIPLYRSMDRTADMFGKIVKNGPYSEVAPKAQMQIGRAREKQADFPDAVKAYEQAADRYSDRPQLAADALFHAGLAHQKQAQTAEYDQGAAGEAIASFTDFITLYSNDARVNDAQQRIGALKAEQSRGSFEIAKYYEKNKKWRGALVYYNEAQLHDPGSPYAAEARQRIDTIRKRLETASK